MKVYSRNSQRPSMKLATVGGVALLRMIPTTKIFQPLLVILLLFSGDASAGDYSIAYAIDANGTTDVGKIGTCTYPESCEIRSAGLRILLDVHYPDHRSVELKVYGPDGCCYSNDADDTFYVDIKPGLLRVPIYAGKQRNRNEFVLNKRFGTVYLEFSEMR